MRRVPALPPARDLLVALSFARLTWFHNAYIPRSSRLFQFPPFHANILRSTVFFSYTAFFFHLRVFFYFSTSSFP